MTGATPQTETTQTPTAPERTAEDTHLDGLLGYGAPTEADTEEAPPAQPAAKNGEDKPDASQAPEKPEARVPLNALHEERARRKEVEAREAQTSKRLQQLLDAMTRQQQPAQPQIPNRDEQPIQHFDARIQTTEQKLAAFEKWQAEQAQAADQHNAVQQIVTQYRAKAEEFAAENKDFGEAYNFLNRHRTEELMDLGWDRANAERIVQQDELAIAAKALQDGANPAQRLYAIAKRRGFKAESPRSNKIETIEKGQRAQGLGGASAAPPANEEVSAKDIADMSDEQFDKFFREKMTPKQFR